MLKSNQKNIPVLMYYYVIQASTAVASKTDAQKNKKYQYSCGLLLCVACLIPFVVSKLILIVFSSSPLNKCALYR